MVGPGVGVTVGVGKRVSVGGGTVVGEGAGVAGADRQADKRNISPQTKTIRLSILSSQLLIDSQEPLGRFAPSEPPGPFQTFVPQPLPQREVA